MLGIPAGAISYVKWGGFALLVIGASALSGALVNSHWNEKWLRRDAADLQAQVNNAAEISRINSQWAERFAALRAEDIAAQKKRDQKYEADLSAYRAGTIKLRQQFTCYRQLSKGAASGRQPDGAGNCGLSDADVQFLISIAREANRLRDKVTSLQGVVNSITTGLQPGNKNKPK